MSSTIPSRPAITKRSLFKEKVIVCREVLEKVHADCFINFCCPDILTGMGYFENIHQLAGPELAESCAKFIGACPTSSRVTSAFGASDNFQFIVHTIVPSPIDLNRLIDVKKVYLATTNSLNMAIEEGAKTIAFPPYFPGISCKVASELLLRIFTVWIHRSQYSEELIEMKICCQNEHEFYFFVQSARSLYEEASIIGHSFVPAFVQQRNAFSRRVGRPRRTHRIFEQPPEDAPRVKLELSAKLAPTILVIDDEKGLKRQYRLTNKSRDGRKMYFRCSRCDTLIKKDGVQIRAKLIVEDGQIVSERYPQHHPECIAKPVEQVLVQQVDRTSRRQVKDLYLLPQDAYKKALDRMNLEARQLGLSVEECFPEWPKLRQQYCRLRKQAVMAKQQEKWQMMMINSGGIIEDMPPSYLRYRYQQMQGPRKRGRPRKDSFTDDFILPQPNSPTEEINFTINKVGNKQKINFHNEERNKHIDEVVNSLHLQQQLQQEDSQNNEQMSTNTNDEDAIVDV
ncbi:unnamed protein product [Meloidogyne enterolobii]|uniref:Uncharacterized protein n=1 Tax=Meloidogyne enterolobii TaxID=390850 RepID=A0ACB1A0L7_MELEN